MFKLSATEFSILLKIFSNEFPKTSKGSFLIRSRILLSFTEEVVIWSTFYIGLNLLLNVMSCIINISLKKIMKRSIFITKNTPMKDIKIPKTIKNTTVVVMKICLFIRHFRFILIQHTRCKIWSSFFSIWKEFMSKPETLVCCLVISFNIESSAIKDLLEFWSRLEFFSFSSFIFFQNLKNFQFLQIIFPN